MATWNVTSWNRKDHEILLELANHKIDICCLSETKKRGKGSTVYSNYILFYSGKENHERAQSGVAILIHKKFEELIDNVQYINDAIMQVTLNTERGTLNILSVYAPDINKTKEDRENFYEKLEDTLNKIPPNEKTFVMGDFNARIGNTAVPGVMQRFNEDVINGNGEMLLTTCAQYELRINNTFFNHKPQYKYTFENTREQKSMIDFVITNRNIHPTEILDVRVLTSANATTEHGLVLCKYRNKITPQRKKPVEYATKFNIESFNNESTVQLYEERLKGKVEINPIKELDNVNQAWEKIKSNLLSSATEALGTRKININGRKNDKPWFTEEVKELAKEKREAYITYRNNKTPTELDKYKVIRNRVNQAIKELKEQYWENFSISMEHDLYGGQKKVWKMLRKRKRPVNEEVQVATISEEQWTTYFKELYTEKVFDETNPVNVTETIIGTPENTEITSEEVVLAIKGLKNRKAPGVDDINNEMLKNGGAVVIHELTTLFNKIIRERKVPEEWRSSITVPIFKKGAKKEPKNYRGITLLSAVLKTLTKILTQIIRLKAPLCEEQQGFRHNRSTVDAIFIMRQLAEKGIEFDKPVFICMVDLQQAFDRIQLKDVIKILHNYNLSKPIIDIVKDLNTKCKTRIKVNQKLTQEVDVNTGIRQGDSLSPTLFNLVMNQIIKDVKDVGVGYRMANKTVAIVCYADDAALIAENEDDLQRLLHRFKESAEKYNMTISIEKTKSLVMSKDPIRCKLMVDGRTIEQVMQFNYLGSHITSCRNLIAETRQNSIKASKISGNLRDIIWKNKYMTTNSKVRIYKTCVRPVLTYAAETRAETSKTKQLLRTTEMKTLRAIKGVTLRDQLRSSDIRQELQTEDVVRWIRVRRRHWRDHVDRMNTSRIAKWAKDNQPETRRPPGRPPKRWKESWTSASQEGQG